MEVVLEVEGLKKSYGKVQALKGVSFHVSRGEIVGYLGPNGAGKTTTLNIITGVISRDEGKIKVLGMDHDEDLLEIKRHIGYIPEDGTVYPFLTGEEYLLFLSGIYGVPRDKVYELMQAFGIYDARRRLVGGYSKGMKQKLLLIGAIMHSPDLLILDEPLSGVDANTALVFKNVLREFAKQGKAVLFSSHILEVVEKLCDRVIILSQGEIIGEGRVEEIKKERDLEEFFAHLTRERDYGEEVKRILEALK